LVLLRMCKGSDTLLNRLFSLDVQASIFGACLRPG